MVLTLNRHLTEMHFIIVLADYLYFIIRLILCIVGYILYGCQDTKACQLSVKIDLHACN